MTLRHLRIFIEVVNCGKMSDVAAKMYISQSSISQAISDLEKYYDVRLFERLNKRLFLTETGRQFYQLASKVILSYDEMNEYMSHIMDKQVLRVGATFTIGSTILPPLFQKMEELHPDVVTKVLIDRTPLLETQLLQGDLDLALVEGNIKSPDLLVQNLITDELFLVCSPDHPFAQRREIELRELEGQDFVMREPSSRTRSIFEAHLARENVSVAEKWTCNNPEAIKAAVMRGYGLSVLSARYIHDEQKKGNICAVPIRGIRMLRDFSLVYHKGKYQFPAFHAFVSLCQTYFSAFYRQDA